MNRKQRRAINRANAALSTGPVTETGKAISSANALKHGLTSIKPYLPVEEQDYKAYAAKRLAILKPQDSTQEDLAQTVIDVEWRLKRLPALEGRLFAEEGITSLKTIRALEVLSRHEMRLRRLLVTTLTDLTERQRNYSTPQKQKALPATGFVLPQPRQMTVAEMCAQTEAITAFLKADTREHEKKRRA